VLQLDINGEPENAMQRDINLLPSGLISVGNVFGLFGQVVVTTLTLEPQLDSSSPRAVGACLLRHQIREHHKSTQRKTLPFTQV